MRRIILSLAAATVLGMSLAATPPARADEFRSFAGYHGQDGWRERAWREHEWRERQAWVWRHHLQREWREHHGIYGY